MKNNPESNAESFDFRSREETRRFVELQQAFPDVAAGLFVKWQNEAWIENLRREAAEKYCGHLAQNVNEDRRRLLEEVQAYQGADPKPTFTEITPEYEGLEQDADMASLPEDVRNAFSENLLNSTLISRITYRPELVNIFFNNQEDYLIPVEEYRKWAKANPEIRSHKVRAENYSRWVSSGLTGGIIPVPIVIFSFEGEDLSEFDYLSDLPEKERMKAYKIGTVTHEIAHFIYKYFLNPDERSEWEGLAQSGACLTPYSKKYADGNHTSPAGYAEEQFCEGVRLLTTNPEYLRSKANDMDFWIRKKFPEIQSYRGGTKGEA